MEVENKVENIIIDIKLDIKSSGNKKKEAINSIINYLKDKINDE